DLRGAANALGEHQRFQPGRVAGAAAPVAGNNPARVQLARGFGSFVDGHRPAAVDRQNGDVRVNRGHFRGEAGIAGIIDLIVVAGNQEAEARLVRVGALRKAGVGGDSLDAGAANGHALPRAQNGAALDLLRGTITADYLRMGVTELAN